MDFYGDYYQGFILSFSRISEFELSSAFIMFRVTVVSYIGFIGSLFFLSCAGLQPKWQLKLKVAMLWANVRFFRVLMVEPCFPTQMMNDIVWWWISSRVRVRVQCPEFELGFNDSFCPITMLLNWIDEWYAVIRLVDVVYGLGFRVSC